MPLEMIINYFQISIYLNEIALELKEDKPINLRVNNILIYVSVQDSLVRNFIRLLLVFFLFLCEFSFL